MEAPTLFVGIDVAKQQLDVALRPGAERFVVPHDEGGLAALVSRLRARQPTLIVLEATGGFEVDVAGALAAAGLPRRRRINWTPRPSPISPKPCARSRGRCRMRRPKS